MWLQTCTSSQMWRHLATASNRPFKTSGSSTIRLFKVCSKCSTTSRWPWCNSKRSNNPKKWWKRRSPKPRTKIYLSQWFSQRSRSFQRAWTQALSMSLGSKSLKILCKNSTTKESLKKNKIPIHKILRTCLKNNNQLIMKSMTLTKLRRTKG